MRERRSTELAPIINRRQSDELFSVPFDKRCGDDNDCRTDLTLTAILLNMTRRADDNAYVTKVTERDAIVIRFVVENRGERAFLAKLFVRYNQDELDVPRLATRKKSKKKAIGNNGVNNNKAPSVLDIERKEDGLVVLTLGNPLEEGQKVSSSY